PLTLVAVPHDSFADKLTSAIPRGNGPDLFIFADDRIGAWAESHTIEPIEFWVDDARADRFSPAAMKSLTYDGSLWGLPLATKSLVLYVRTDLVSTPPTTTDELIALAPMMRKQQGFAVAYANADLYGHAPWLHGFGGKVIDDSGELAIATPEAAAAMAFARKLVAEGVAPADAQAPMVASLFNAGKAATVLSGPWFIADIGKDVPWQVVTLPVISETGKPAAPFLGAESVLMSAYAHDKTAAFAVMDALTSDDAAITRARVARQVVANPAAYTDAEIARDPVLPVFRAQLEHTVPMPKVPAMRMVWTPYQNALGEVLAGRSDPSTQLENVRRDVEGYLRR
ncbi:MAG TPA: extracellular solute-binding protein, partial [Kofleriaceae bacterium]|nr:extracellular solute-binding protein [Kofleriaceae bacterium]